MSKFFKDLKQGLKQALAHKKGKITLPTELFNQTKKREQACETTRAMKNR